MGQNVTERVMVNRITGRQSLQVEAGKFVAEGLSFGLGISDEAATIADILVGSRKFSEGHPDSVAEQEQQTSAALRGIGWLTALNLIVHIEDQLRLTPQATRVVASIWDRHQEVVPKWQISSGGHSYHLFPERHWSKGAKDFHDWVFNCLNRDDRGAYIPSLGTPTVASAIEMSIDSGVGRLELVAKKILGLSCSQELGSEDYKLLTSWIVLLSLVLPMEPNNIIDQLKLRRGILPSRTFYLEFIEPTLGKVVAHRDITLNNLRKSALSLA